MSGPIRNSQHEAFANAIVKGMNATDAYKAAGYKGKGKSAWEAASRLARNVKVRARVAELKAKTAGHTVKTAAQVLSDLARNADAAFVKEQFTASNQALRYYGQEAHGQFVEKHELAFKRIEDMTEDEKRAALGLAKDEPLPDA